MPTRKLPRTTREREIALEAAKVKKDSTSATDMPLSAGTITRLDATHSTFTQRVSQLNQALLAQTTATALAERQRSLVRKFVSHFFIGLNNAIERETSGFTPQTRNGYGLDTSDASVPSLASHGDVNYWALKIRDGETARIANGGTPMAFPSAAEVEAARVVLEGYFISASAKKNAYDSLQEQLAADSEEAQSLIKRIWNEVEAFYSEETPNSLRRKAREWGVFYVPNRGETPSPDEASLYGQVVAPAGTSETSSIVLPDTTVRIADLNFETTTNEEGYYLVPPQPAGTYSVEFTLSGYQPVVETVALSPDVARQLNVRMLPEGT